MLISSPLFTVLGIIQFTVIAILLNSFVRYTKKIATKIINYRTALTSFYSEAYAADRTVRLFKLEPKQREILNRLSLNFLTQQRDYLMRLTRCHSCLVYSLVLP